jgi:hypothetical protein
VSTGADLAQVLAALGADPGALQGGDLPGGRSPGAVAYQLQPTGRPLYPPSPGSCWYCLDARHGERGSSCPVKFLPLGELAREDLPGWLRRERGMDPGKGGGRGLTGNGHNRDYPRAVDRYPPDARGAQP